MKALMISLKKCPMRIFLCKVCMIARLSWLILDSFIIFFLFMILFKFYTSTSAVASIITEQNYIETT